tara:strand:- start:3418 stop:3834 length:417 start_codon:yes stop_codon:yes gene_type:complete
MELLKKNLIIKYLLFVLLILTSCKNETCKGVEFIDGMTFKNGALYSGTCINHHTNGEIRSIQNYKKGYDHGKWEFFYANKKNQVKGTFNMGKKNGEWTYYHENGELHKQHFYDNGKKIGLWKTYDENGVISSASNVFN